MYCVVCLFTVIKKFVIDQVLSDLLLEPSNPKNPVVLKIVHIFVNACITAANHLLYSLPIVHATFRILRYRNHCNLYNQHFMLLNTNTNKYSIETPMYKL